jgi:predicted nucleotidyltransferase
VADVAPFDPLAALTALRQGAVDFVLIGGVAARLHGSPSLTRDVDICYDRDRDNVERLADVLRELHARLRGVDDDVPFLLDARTLLAGNNFTFVTDVGDVDVLSLPAGVDGYAELARSAELVDLGDVSVLVATVEDLIRMKTAAGRAKDRAEVEILAALREERDRDP